MVESTRETIGRNGTGHTSVERRYYISSLPATAALLGKTVRAHRELKTACTGCLMSHSARMTAESGPARRHRPSPSYAGLP